MIKYLIPIYLICLLIPLLILYFLGGILNTNLLNGWTVFGGALILTIIYFSVYYFRRRNGEIYGSVDKSILILIVIFCKRLTIETKKSKYYVLNIFKSYNSNHTKKLFERFYNRYNDLKKNSEKLINTSIEAKEFLMNALFEIASKDRLLSVEEEKLIEFIGGYMRFNKVSYQRIKQIYLKTGMQEERKLIEEENRKKLAESFVPYNAYKVLGITPNITKEQLKKVYRKLAKKFHPDKFHGQSIEIIEKAEVKFQEITKAYEIIQSHKNFLKKS